MCLCITVEGHDHVYATVGGPCSDVCVCVCYCWCSCLDVCMLLLVGHVRRCVCYCWGPCSDVCMLLLGVMFGCVCVCYCWGPCSDVCVCATVGDHVRMCVCATVGGHVRLCVYYMYVWTDLGITTHWVLVQLSQSIWSPCLYH